MDFFAIVKRNKVLASLLGIGTLVWSITMVKSGLVYSFGMGFWGPNGHDGVWHIALINHLARGNFQMPVFAGEMLKNYHIGFDMVLAILHKVTQIPAHTLYFQIIPPVLALSIGWLTYTFVWQWRQSKSQALWSVFFVYFGGNFGWIITLLRSGEVGGESMFWSQQAISTLINPPFALSIVLLLIGMILLLRLQSRITIYQLLITILLFGIMVQIKAYAAVLALTALGIAGFVQVVRKKKLTLLLICGAAFIVSLLLLYPLNRQPQRVFVFEPFWFLETMMALQDRLYWPKFFEAMTNYRLGDVWGKMVLAYTVAFFIFIVGNMGTRVIGLIEIAKRGAKKQLDLIDIFLLTVFFMGVVMPMFILQTGTPWNTIQFFYYSLFVLSIYAGIWMGDFLQSVSKKRIYHISIYDITVWAVILLTIPTTIATLKHYLPARPPAKISHEELKALDFLREQERGVVLTYPFDRYKANLEINNPPRSLYVYESTAYVSAFSGQPVYIEDEVNLDITGYNWKPRRKDAEEFFDTLDISAAQRFLQENSISYFYLVPSQSPVVGQRFRLGESELGLQNIFESDEVVIYRVLDTIEVR